MINWQELKSSLQKITLNFDLKKLKTSLPWKSIWIIFSCTLLILTAVYVKRQELKNLLAPPSPHTINENLTEKIQATDQIIFHQLSQLSIPENHISLKQFQKKDGRIEWNYSITTVILPPDINFDQVENAFNRVVKFFELEDLKWHFVQDKDNCLNINVHIQRFKTHQLTFCYTSPAPEQQIPLENTYRVSIVIDDLGENYKIFKKLLAMHTPFTFSILPFQTHSIRIANEAYEKGREVILHLPLEPKDSFNNSINHGTLLTSMRKEQLLAQLERNINAVPHISGVSSHMGSKFTEDKAKMEILLKAIKEKGLYFLDSRTTKKTVGYALAKNMGIKTAQRDLFIDNDKDPLSIEEQLKSILPLAKNIGGNTIAIGHPYPPTINALEKTIPILEERGIKIVPLSQMVN